jgi:iron complex transport system substrate-binding protein
MIAGFKLNAGEIARRSRTSRARYSQPRRVLLLEWLDPPFSSGHWNPEIIERAGGFEVIGQAGLPSRRLTWKKVAAVRPDVVIVAPCGFNLERGKIELSSIQDRPEWCGLPAVQSGGVVIADGSALFSRPGPRLRTSLHVAAAAIDPENCADLAPATGTEWMFWPVTR